MWLEEAFNFIKQEPWLKDEVINTKGFSFREEPLHESITTRHYFIRFSRSRGDMDFLSVAYTLNKSRWKENDELKKDLFMNSFEVLISYMCKEKYL